MTALRGLFCLFCHGSRILQCMSCTSFPVAKKREIGVLIAQIWARADINAAWKAVSQSKLSITDKQIMFNALWG